MGYYMKKISFRKSFFTCLSGAVLFTTMLLFTSCENFLKGANVRQELEEAIEIANASPVTYYVIADQGSGTVNPSQLRLKKKESFDIMFVPNDDWKFICWEVLDRDSGEVVEDSIKFTDAKALETKGTVLATRENLMIHPKCIKLPAVVSHTPAVETETNYANTPIILNFNMELDEENFAEGGVFEDYDFITMTYSGSPVTNLFEKPVLSENKTSIMLMPKPDELAYYIKEEKKAAYIDVVVGFKDGISILAGGQSSPMGAGQSFSVRYNSTVETEPPTEVQFVVSRPDDKNNTFDIRTNLDSNLVRQNRAKGIIYIYGKYTDSGSGVKTVQVKEKRTMETFGQYVSGIEVKQEYTAQNATFINSGSITEFYIEHELQTETGLYQIDVTVYDACKNPAELKSFSVVNISSQNYYNSDGELFDVYNYKDMKNEDFRVDDPNFSIGDLTTLYITKDSIFPINDDVIPLKQTLLANITNNNYKSFNLTCTYKNKNNVIVTEKFEPKEDDVREYLVYDDEEQTTSHIENTIVPYWTLKLDVDKVSGLELIITVTDDIGISIEKRTKFLPEPEVVIVDEEGKKKLRCFYEDFNDDYTTWYKKTKDGEISYLSYLSEMENGCKYQIIPVNKTLISEVYDKDYSTSTTFTEPTAVEWDGDPTLRRSEEQGKLIVTLKIKNPENYGKVYCKYQKVTTYSFGVQQQIFITPVWEQYFTPGEATMEYIINTTDVYGYDLLFDLYNVDGNSQSTASQKVISKITSPAYDNVPPTATLLTTKNLQTNESYLKFDTYTVKLEDKYSNVDSAWLIKADGSTLPLVENEDMSTVLLTIPSWQMHEYGSTITFCDTAGNYGTKTITLYGQAKIKIASVKLINNSLKWKLVAEYGELATYAFKYFYWDSDNKKWIQDTSFNGHNELPIYGDKFYRIEYTNSDSAHNICEVGIPQYFYFSLNGLNTGRYDYITPFTDDSVFIVSDAPIYIETIITTKPYNECKNWTIEEWDGFHHREGGDYIEFPANNPSPMRYKIPLDKINSKECYVVLAHFADGSSTMTEVKEKP